MTASVMPTYNRIPLNFVKGEGSWLIEADGRRFLDMGAGIAVNTLGHAAPELVEVLTEQAQKLWHVSNLYTIPAQQALADAIVANTFADTVFFTNSGTETMELAIKLIRKFHYEQGAPRETILTFEGAFHGRSTGAIAAAAGSEKMVKGFGPLMPGFKILPWNDIEALRAALDDSVAGVIIEPIQGEGGIRTLPDSYLKELRALCDKSGAVLVFDEVQCGVARTGRLFAYEWAGISPDAMMIAKGIGGGFPLGAVAATAKAAGGMVPGTHGSTYGGNPLGCAIGLKVLEIVTDPAFLAEVNRKAGLLRQKLEGLLAEHPDTYDEVRGQGLMLGLHCKKPVGDIAVAARDHGLLVVPAADNVIRLLPALNIPDEDLAEAVRRLAAAAEALEIG